MCKEVKVEVDRGDFKKGSQREGICEILGRFIDKRLWTVNEDLRVKVHEAMWNFLNDGFRSWEHFSGCLTHPVSKYGRQVPRGNAVEGRCTCGFSKPGSPSPEEQYYEGKLWEGESRALRLHLLRHLARRAKDITILDETYGH